MKNIERVIVGYDGSELGRAAFAYGIQVAEACDLPMLAVTVIERHAELTPLPIPVDPFLTGVEAAVPVIDWARVQAEAEAGLDELAAYAAERSVPFERVCRDGTFASVLGAIGKVSDLVVVGSHGRHERAGFGSTTRALVKHCAGPVMIVPSPLRPLERVVAVSDGSKVSAHAVALAEALALETGWTLTVVAVCGSHEELDDALQRAQDLAPDAQVVHMGPEHESEAAQIERVGKLSELAVLVMGAYPDHPLQQLLFGGTTGHVLRHVQNPVVLVR